MNVVVRDAATLHALGPLDLASYLRAKGWQQQPDRGQRASLWLWRTPGGDELDVLLPSTREVADYNIRVSEVLHALSIAEGRSELDVINDLQTTGADIIRVKAGGNDLERGSLPLDQGVTLVERCREMMLAAACAAISKRPFYAKRKPQQAMDYLSHVRMGQTERGSFVLTLLSPVSPALRVDQQAAATLEPFERSVTRTLVAGLCALGEASRDAAISGVFTPFEAAIARGVSANLCEAVVGLAGVSPAQGVDVQVSWSRNRPNTDNGPIRVRLGSDSIPLIEEAARQFRAIATQEDTEILGFVERLDRAQDAAEGEATVVALIDDKVRRVAIRLEPQMYAVAVQAHDERRTVRCIGDLVRERGGWRLLNPRRFEMTDEPVE
jgi:hypothetical protein